VIFDDRRELEFLFKSAIAEVLLLSKKQLLTQPAPRQLTHRSILQPLLKRTSKPV
jgi:hypothetical protein